MTQSVDEAVDNVLAHYGVKGMKWGVRRSGPQAVTVKTAPGRKVQAQGGRFAPPSDDAVRAAKLKQQAKKSTTDSLSNKELQEAVTRMNLEQQFNRLQPKSPMKQLVDKLFSKEGKKTMKEISASPQAKQVADVLKARVA